MPDLIACPKCGAKYARGGRPAGKSVVCECGQRFSVPAVAPRPEKAPASSPSRRAIAGPRRTQPQILRSPPPHVQRNTFGGNAAPDIAPRGAHPLSLGDGDGDPMNFATVSGPPLPSLRPRLKPTTKTKKAKNRKLSGVDRIAEVVLVVILPIAAVCTFVGVIGYVQTGRIGPFGNWDRSAETTSQPATQR